MKECDIQSQSANHFFDGRVVILTNTIAPYDLSVYEEIKKNCRELYVLLSADSNPNTNYEKEWGSLNVILQKTFTFSQNWTHNSGHFTDKIYVHIPLDTVKLLRELKPNMIVSSELGFRSLACAWYRYWYDDSRLILRTCMTQHTEQGRGRLRSILRKWLVRRADALTYNGPESRRLLEKMGLNESKLYPFYYSAHQAHRRAPPVDKTALLSRKLLFVGQISERKGVRQMINALIRHAKSTPDVSIKLTIVGEGPLKQALASMNRPDNLKVIFTGNIPVYELPDHIREHGVLIFPTMSDEWGLVVNESLHAGLPVIASNLAQSSVALIKNNENGWLFDPRLMSEWSRVLNGYLRASDSKLLDMSENCRLSSSHLTPEWACSGVLDAFHQLGK